MAGAKKKNVELLPENTPFRKSDASRILGVSRPTIDRMLKDGRLQVSNIAGIEMVKRTL